MKKVFCFCLLIVTFSGCEEKKTKGKVVIAPTGTIPGTVIEALDMFLDICIEKHCSGSKLVLLPGGKMELFEGTNFTDEQCMEKANQAIEASDWIAKMLGKRGGTSDPTPGGPEVEGETIGPHTANPGEGYFWAVEYIQCRTKCLNTFRLSVLKP